MARSFFLFACDWVLLLYSNLFINKKRKTSVKNTIVLLERSGKVESNSTTVDWKVFFGFRKLFHICSLRYLWLVYSLLITKPSWAGLKPDSNQPDICDFLMVGASQISANCGQLKTKTTTDNLHYTLKKVYGNEKKCICVVGPKKCKWQKKIDENLLSWLFQAFQCDWKIC